MTTLLHNKSAEYSPRADKHPNWMQRILWWLLFGICTLYGGYAFYMGVVELLALLGILTDSPHRGVPTVFVLHALAGGFVLLCGALQLNQQIQRRYRGLHRLAGRIYVGGVWISSLGSLWLTFYFDVNLAAKLNFILLSTLWFGTTTMGLVSIRQRKLAKHQAWMMRSFALSFFFITFSFWVPGLTSTSLPIDLSYPLAAFLSWSLNLLVAEWWVRRQRLVT